jgi:hypothetical protein
VENEFFGFAFLPLAAKWDDFSQGWALGCCLRWVQGGFSPQTKGNFMQRKQFLQWACLALGSAAAGVGLSACGGGDSVDAALPAVSGGALSAEEIAGLYYMREEEKLAYDVYVALYARWGAQVFNNIANSESEHTEAVRQRIVAHGLADPAASTPAGVFVNADLQALYNQLVAQGQGSLIDALKVGCWIEEKDIRDIEDQKSQVINEPDIVAVYESLLCGSRNHLRAFNSQLVAQGGSYTAQVISQDEWNAIANSAREACAR